MVFELTETAILSDIEAARAFIDELHAMQCKVALDDFGTGYGGFTYLKQLPIDYLKIDMEFVRDLRAQQRQPQRRGSDRKPRPGVRPDHGRGGRRGRQRPSSSCASSASTARRAITSGARLRPSAPPRRIESELSGRQPTARLREPSDGRFPAVGR